MLTKTIGVFGLFATAPGEVVTTRFSNAGLSWLFDVNQSHSLTRYWRDVMDGYFQLLPTVQGLLNAQVSASVVATIAGGNRWAAVEQVATVLENAGISVTGFDLLAFFVGGRPVGAGTAAVKRDDWIPTSIFDDFSSLSFMQHELGHLLGLDHPFDTRLVKPDYLNGEYGDPVCIMSAENFGGHASAFKVPAAEQNPVFASEDVVWARTGPGVSPTSVWRFAQEFPKPLPWMTVLPANAQPTTVRLMRPGFSQGTRLVVMPAGGNTWFTVEYRPSTYWDKSFIPNAKADQTLSGVVIHEIRDVGMPSNGPGWPKIQQVCYESTIPTPSTGDLDWSNARFAVRVISARPNWADIEVGASLPGVPTISLDFLWDENFESSSPGAQIEVSRVGRRCEKGVYTSKRSLYSASLQGTVTTSGFESPVFRFELNNVALGGWNAPGVPFSGVANVTVAGEVPTSMTTKSNATLKIGVSYQGDGNSVAIDVPSGDGAYELILVAYATEDPSKDPNGIVSAAGRAPISTLRFVLPGEAITDMGACIKSMADGIRHRNVWPPPRDEHPNWRERGIDEIWIRDRLPQLGDAIIKAVELERVNPAVGARLIEDAATRLGMLPTEFRDLAAQVREKLKAPR
jgi:hypothetical protein